MNFSNITFTSNEISFLEKSLKFSPSIGQNSKYFNTFKASLENIFSKFPQSFKDTINTQNLIPSNFTSLKQHFNLEHALLVKSIQEKLIINNLILTKADKGNCTVILKKDEYIEKTSNFLKSPDFLLLSDSPLNKFVNSTKDYISSTNDSLKYFNLHSYNLRISNPRIPTLHSLPKIHKLNLPIRPIVNFIGCPTYPITKFLANLFRRSINFKPVFSVNNTSELISRLNNFNFNNHHNFKIVSFDIVNLFTSVPPLEVLPLVSNLLNSTDLPDTVTSDILGLTEFCLNNVFFQFNQRYYKQVQGLPMGSPLSPILAEIFMNNFETSYITTNPLFLNNVACWIRYVDDVFYIFKGSNLQINAFLNFLNSIHSRIKFTVEIPLDNSLPFLDLLISIGNDNFIFDIYRKPTTTNQVLPFDSNHPLSHKLTSFYYFFNRLISTPLSTANYNKKLQTIFYLAHVNNFPLSLIGNIYNKLLLKKHITSVTSLSIIKNDCVNYFSVPYFPQFYHLISKLNKAMTLKFLFKTSYPTQHLFNRH
ncbi:hypothetical protein RN001_009561 [Aquatica leii]|uniref:Reverse transcriptase domain-containing protein n=1 Tax=Aquatica leii TaxID=1421715 RepID=A0AAN7Q2K1_9COLE|nr:hypothetical protein RN001_009561 [Aquatica leii]